MPVSPVMPAEAGIQRKIKNWMPHRPVFLPLTTFAGKTGVWHDKIVQAASFYPFSCRRFLPCIASCLIATMLSGCGEDAATKEHKKEALTGRQEIGLRLAHATEAGGDLAGAEKIYLKVADQMPQAAAPRIELAQFYKRHHEERKAIESLKTGLELEPGNTDIKRELANTYIAAGESKKALTLLDDAIAANPKDFLLHNSRGVALDQLGKYEEARQSYRKASDLNPAGATTYKVNISMSYILSGDYGKAIALLRPMADASDAPPIVRQNLALAYGLNGDSEKALQMTSQDLSATDAAENVRFYRMLARKHGTGAGKKAGVSAVPASVVKELFPEEEPADNASPATAAASVVPKPATPEKPAAIIEPQGAKNTKPKPAVAKSASDDDEEEVIPPPRLESEARKSSLRDESPLPKPVLKPDVN